MATRASDRVTLATLPAPTGVRVYYKLQASNLAAPPKPTTNPPSGWTTTEPAYTEGSTDTLYTVNLVLYGTVAWEYGDVQKSSAFEAAKAAYNKAANAITVANLASAAAAGMVKASAADPGHQAGRIWLQLDGSGRGIGIKISDGAAWSSYALMADQVLVPGSAGSATIANGAVQAVHVTASESMSAKLAQFLKVQTRHMDAGSINVDRLNVGTFRGKVIEGATLIASDSNGSPDNVTIANRSIKVNRNDADGGYTSMTLGGGQSDVVKLVDPTGVPQVGLYGDGGNAYFAGDVQAGAMYVEGKNVLDMISDRPLGVVAKWESWQSWHKAGTNEIGVAELYHDFAPGRIYRVVFDGLMQVATPGDVVRMFLRQRQSSPGDPATVSSTGIALADYPTSGGAFTRVHFETIYRPTGRGSLLFTYCNNTANRAVNLYGRGATPAVAYIEDLGKTIFNSEGNSRGVSTLGGGVPLVGDGGSGSTGTTRYTKTYSPTWVKSWRGSTVVTDYLHHGVYGGTRRYSMVGFGGSLATDLAGATGIVAEVYLPNLTWWGSSGTAYVSPSTAASAPASADLAGAHVTSSGWPEGKGRWVTVPWTAATRAVTLGDGAPATNEAYGKFARSGAQLRVSYTK